MECKEASELKLVGTHPESNALSCHKQTCLVWETEVLHILIVTVDQHMQMSTIDTHYYEHDICGAISFD